MSEIGQGRGSSYPNGLDTDNSPEQNDVTRARAEVPNDLIAAIIAKSGRHVIEEVSNEQKAI